METVGELSYLDDTIVETAEHRGIVSVRTYEAIHIVPEGIGIGSVSLGVGTVGLYAKPGDLIDGRDSEVGKEFAEILTGHLFCLVAKGCLGFEGEFLRVNQRGSVDVVAGSNGERDVEENNLAIGA